MYQETGGEHRFGGGIRPWKRRIGLALVGGILLFSAVYLALGSIRDVECEVLDATSSVTNLSARATTTITPQSVTIQFACTNSGWISLSNVTAEVRIAEKDQDIGGGWYSAGELVAVQQVPLGTLEPGIPVIKRTRIRGLHWNRDIGVRIRPYQV